MIEVAAILLAFAQAGAAIPPVAPVISYGTISRIPDKALDFAFMHVQESWMVENGLDAVGSLPSGLRRAVADLEHDDWRVRDRASKAIRAIATAGGPDAMRLVMRASLAKTGSRETWLRCRTILRAMSICDNCHGAGEAEVTWGMTRCSNCQAVGWYFPLDNFLE